MFFGQDVLQFRRMFYTAWSKHLNKQPLEPVEQQIVMVIEDHPEYQTIFNNEKALDTNYFPELGETNPFLHMSLHLSLREQVVTNRPAGIQTIFAKLCETMKPIDAEHTMLDILAESLWTAQKNQSMPDEATYLTNLKKLIE